MLTKIATAIHLMVRTGVAAANYTNEHTLHLAVIFCILIRIITMLI